MWKETEIHSDEGIGFRTDFGWMYFGFFSLHFLYIILRKKDRDGAAKKNEIPQAGTTLYANGNYNSDTNYGCPYWDEIV